MKNSNFNNRKKQDNRTNRNNNNNEEYHIKILYKLKNELELRIINESL